MTITYKNKAEAEKTAGVDTEAQKATIDNLIAQTSNEKTKKGLILGQIRVADAEEELKRKNKTRTTIRTNQRSRRRRRTKKKYRRLDKGKSRGNTMEC